MWTVYILWSESRKRFYKGVSGNVARRLGEHNAHRVTSTKAGCPWVLVHTETFDTKTEALKRERFFKTRSGYRWLKNHDIVEANGGVAESG